MNHTFAHENLDCYKLAVQVARWFQVAPFPRGMSKLKDQGNRAAESIVLNIAEGSGRRHGTGDAGKNHHDIALGSAAECCAVLDLVHTLDGAREQQDNLRRIGAMLAKMSR